MSACRACAAIQSYFDGVYELKTSHAQVDSEAADVDVIHLACLTAPKVRLERR
jgi:hypothetical protein